MTGIRFAATAFIVATSLASGGLAGRHERKGIRAIRIDAELIPLVLKYGARSTFIFVAFLARSPPTSRRQSSRRALRAAKQVLEFRSASFSRLAFVL